MKGTKDGNGEEEISVYNYFFDTYSRKLKNLNFPALDLGNSRKPIYMPIEVMSAFPRPVSNFPADS